ncbi:MAG: 2OG-Fe(II) oxygenase [Pseudomonadota bacterium]
MNTSLAVAPGDQTFDAIVDALCAGRHAVIDGFLPDDLCDRLRREVEQLDNTAMPVAGVGRGDNHLQANSVRNDQIRWLRGNSPAQCQYLAIMEGLRTAINRALFMGLFEYEAHFALYPPGASYQKHVDAFKGRRNRVVTTVCYLNREWSEADAGELLIYSPERAEMSIDRVAPLGGRLVVFASEDFPHEVLPAHRHRYSIAGWFRLNTSSGQRVDPLG